MNTPTLRTVDRFSFARIRAFFRLVFHNPLHHPTTIIDYDNNTVTYGCWQCDPEIRAEYDSVQLDK